ncbi:MAG TPA: heavy metal-responsive transcriptional regulator [Ktedonobacterales bacterium]
MNRMTGCMTIGRLARRAGITARAARYYERIGLLTPATRTPSGYRLYTDTALERLAFIRRAQAQGLPLADIAVILATRDAGSAPCRETRALAELRLLEVNARITALQAARDSLKKLIERAEQVEETCAGAPGVCLAFNPS